MSTSSDATSSDATATRWRSATVPAWRPPLTWRLLLLLASLLVPLLCRLRVSGEIPAELRGRSVILASNHIGTFDPIALAAACRRRRLAPRILATAGLFTAPLVGRVLRRCGHIRVNRADASVVEALDEAVRAVGEGSVVAGYPEGRISLDPGLWPERARTGLARLALLTGTPVVPVSQWGAHEVLAWDSPAGLVADVLSAIRRRPVVHVRFGPPVDLTDLRAGVPGDAQRAASRVMRGIVDGLVPLRHAEPDLPRRVDPSRPLSSARTLRRG